MTGCVFRSEPSEEASAFNVLRGELETNGQYQGVVRDYESVESLLILIGKDVNPTKGSICIVSPVLGQGGYTYEIGQIRSLDLQITAKLRKEDLFGAAVLHQIVVCVIPVRPLPQTPLVTVINDIPHTTRTWIDQKN